MKKLLSWELAILMAGLLTIAGCGYRGQAEAEPVEMKKTITHTTAYLPVVEGQGTPTPSLTATVAPIKTATPTIGTKGQETPVLGKGNYREASAKGKVKIDYDIIDVGRDKKRAFVWLIKNISGRMLRGTLYFDFKNSSGKSMDFPGPLAENLHRLGFYSEKSGGALSWPLIISPDSVGDLHTPEVGGEKLAFAILTGAYVADKGIFLGYLPAEKSWYGGLVFPDGAVSGEFWLEVKAAPLATFKYIEDPSAKGKIEFLEYKEGFYTETYPGSFTLAMPIPGAFLVSYQNLTQKTLRIQLLGKLKGVEGMNFPPTPQYLAAWKKWLEAYDPDKPVFSKEEKLRPGQKWSEQVVFPAEATYYELTIKVLEIAS